MPPIRLYQQKSFAPFPITYSSKKFAPLVKDDCHIWHACHLLRSDQALLARLHHYLMTCSTIFSLKQTIHELRKNRDCVFDEFILFIDCNLFLYNLDNALVPLFQSTPPQTVILHDLHFDKTILVPLNHLLYDFLMLYMITPCYHCIPLHHPFVPRPQFLHRAPLVIVLLWWLTLILVRLVVLTQAIFQGVHIKLREFKCYQGGSVMISFYFSFLSYFTCYMNMFFF